MNTQIEKKLYNEKCLAFHIFVHTLDFEKKTFLQASAYNIYNRSQPEEAFRGIS